MTAHLLLINELDSRARRSYWLVRGIRDDMYAKCKSTMSAYRLRKTERFLHTVTSGGWPATLLRDSIHNQVSTAAITAVLRRFNDGAG